MKNNLELNKQEKLVQELNVKLKTQTFGVGKFFTTNGRQQCFLSKLRSDGISNYRANRENGNECDLPSRSFPGNGNVTWIKGRPYTGKCTGFVRGVQEGNGWACELRYNESTDDKQWMEEKDKNYLNRLNKEKQKKELKEKELKEKELKEKELKEKELKEKELKKKDLEKKELKEKELEKKDLEKKELKEKELKKKELEKQSSVGNMKIQTYGVSQTESMSFNQELSSEATVNYWVNRANGSNLLDDPGASTNSPGWKFPFDGKFSWVNPNQWFSKIRYDEGQLDKKWMKKKDQKYLKRLEKERFQEYLKRLEKEPDSVDISNRKQIEIISLGEIENLVFQGGGVKGTAYIGALETLCDKDSISHVDLKNIKRVAGASAGSIIALLIALGKKSDDISNIMRNLDLKDLLDKGEKVNGYTLRDTILKTLGMYRNLGGNCYIDWFLYYLCRYLENEGINFASKKAAEYVKKFLEERPEIQTVFEFLKGLWNVGGGFINGVIGAVNYVSGGSISSLPYAEEVLKSVKNAVQSGAQDIFKNFSNYLVNIFFKKDLAGMEKTLASFFNEDLNILKNFNASFFRVIDMFIKGGAKGLFSGNNFVSMVEKWVTDVVGVNNKGITFNDFFKQRDKFSLKELYVVGLNLSTGLTEIFSHKHTPNMTIVSAIRISMSIPYFFTPYEMPNSKNIYVDGGVLDNYPIWIFDKFQYTNKQHFSLFASTSKPVFKSKTLGFKLVTTDQKRLYENKQELNTGINSDSGVIDFTIGLGSVIFNKQDNDHYHSKDRFRTVYIDTKDVSLIDFDLDSNGKKQLINSGKDGVYSYLTRTIKREKKQIVLFKEGENNETKTANSSFFPKK